MDVEGLGNCRAGEESVARLLGKNPFDFYRPGDYRMEGPLGAGTMPLWDLAGKVLKKPVYELLGGGGRHPVPVYDGSIYFADLLPQYEANWPDRFREEIDMGMEIGHRAFKVKIGRGNRWMNRAAGDDRDVAVIETIRRHNADVLLGVDANNGYDLAGAKRFLQRVGSNNIAFAEELFAETVEECLDFKRFIADSGWNTLLADGETQRELEAYRPFIDAQAVDVFQGDMNRFGIEGILTEAAWAHAKGLVVAPHNWGSLVGFYMQLQVGRAVPNLYRAEHDPLSNRVLIADGYAIQDGCATVPDTPGFGLAINEDRFASDVKINFDLHA
jgi:L-alanine-DL-glutamate epimerase-like enolase superfamily enzyme